MFKDKKVTYLLLAFFVLILFFSFSVKQVQADITTNSVSTGSCDCAQLTISNHSISGTRPFLVVGIGLEDGKIDNTVNSVTYNGTALTRLAQGVGSDAARTDIWYLDPSSNPPDGNYNVVINIANKNKVTAGAITFNGVENSNPVDTGTVQVNTGTAALSSSVNVPSSVDDLVMNAATVEKASLSFGASQTQRWNLPVGGGDYSTGASTKVSTSDSTQMSVSFSDSKKFSHLGFNINRAPQCNDGLDNDGDGDIDYPTDSSCSSLTDDNELNPTPGLEDRTVSFEGRAYPNSRVYFLGRSGGDYEYIDSNPFITRERGVFEQGFNIGQGYTSFAVQAVDPDNRSTEVIPVDRVEGSSSRVETEYLVLPPTINVEKSFVRHNERLMIFGYGVSSGMIELKIDGDFVETVEAREDGYWEYDMDVSSVGVGTHEVSVRHSGTVSSIPSSPIEFEVSSLTVPQADLNQDGRISISDLSIFLFRWVRGGDIRQTIDMNGDGVVNIQDFSILLQAI